MGAREDLIAIPDEQLRRGDIGQAVLVHMDFRDSPKRWWAGFGNFDVGGFRWEGLGDLIDISQLSTTYQLSAAQVTFTVAATPEMLTNALNAKDRVRDRPVTVYQQLLAGHQPLGSPFALFSGSMQDMPWSASGPSLRTLTVESEGVFFRRNAPPWGRWTEVDQRARYGVDRGFERLPLYTGGYETRWR